jgi:hypothetical protein
VSAAEHAEAAAEALRNLNRATLGPDGYQWPSDVDTVIGDLQVTAHRMQQALQQAARWLNRAEQEGRIGVDTPAVSSTELIEALDNQLRAAVMSAADLASTLDGARRFTSHLTGLD